VAAPRCNVAGASLICPRFANVIVALGHSAHLRILHISSAQTFAGGERYLVDLVNALAARGHELFVAVRRRSPLNDKLELPSENVIELPLRNALDAKSAGALAKLTRDRQIEIVHVHMARDYPLAAYAVRRSAGAKLIVTRHVLFPLNRLHKLTLARVSKVIAVSHAVARDVGAQALVASHKIAVIHNGVDVDRIESVRSRFQRTEFLRRWDLPEDRLLVGSVGTLTPLKGYEDLLRAAARVRDVAPEAFFVISGVDSSPGQTYQSTLERLIGELDLGDHVRLINWMDDITELFCALNIFVSASHSESFGLAIVEAMAAGAAIVATQTEGASEIIRDGETGQLVPVGDAEQMARAIISLLRDSETRQTMADAARTAVEGFSLARMVDETEELYSEALEK
jgi:glycosyltransferase involved in cell wall biosynthesis